MKAKFNKLFTLLTILTLGITNVWAQETVTVDLALAKNSDPSPSIGEIIGTNYSKGSFDGNGYKIGSDNNSIGWNIASSGKTFTSVSFEGYINTTNTAKNWGFKFSTDGGTTWGAELTQANDGTKSYHSINVTVAIPEGANAIQIIRKAGTSTYVRSITLTLAPDAGGDPVCPGTLTITSKDSKTAFLEGDAIELTAALSEGNGAITYQWYKGGTAEGNKLAGKTAAKLEIASCVEGDAGDYYCIASKDDCSDAVNAAAFAITVAHNPCATYFWFFSDADQTANGKTNATSVFSNMVGGGSNLSGSITIDETTYNVTRRTGDTDPLGGFIVPANKVATFYALAVSSGDGARKIVLTNTTTSATYEADVAGGNTSYKRVQIDNIAPGTYSIGKSGGNTRLGMVALKVCDATFRTITFDSNGGSTVADLSVLDGTTATQPTDPTWAHHRFAGWYNGASPYDWASTVSGDITLTAHWTQLYTITYAAGDGTATGDAPTQEDKAEGETFSVAANTFTVAGKDFVTWNDGANDYAPSATYTVGTDNVILTAQWTTAADKYTVHYMDEDGTTPLGADELVNVGEHPAGITATKPLFTFASWQLSGSDIALSSVSAAKDEEVTLTARWTKAFAANINFEAFIDAQTTSGNWQAELAAKNYAISSTTSVTLDAPDGKPADKGLKIKNSGAYISFNVNASKLVLLKAGVLSGAEASVDGGANYTALTGASGSTGASVVTPLYNATEAEYRIRTTTGSYNIIQSITITNPYTVTFEAHGDADPTPLQGTPSVTLPTPTNGTASFTGWFDAETGGNKIGNAGATYIPTANITLHAQWEAVSSDNTLSDLKVGGVTVDGFDPAVHTYYVVLPYGTAVGDIPAISATANSAKAKQVAIEQAVWTGDPYNCYRAQANVQAEDESWGYYDVRFSFAPKDGASIFKAELTSATTATYSGIYADADNSQIKLADDGANGYKFGGTSNFIKMALDGGTFATGDLLTMTYSKDPQQGELAIYENTTKIVGTSFENHTLEFTAGADGLTELFIRRTSDNNFNGWVSVVEVTRVVNPMLTAITFAGEAGTINESLKTVTVTVPNATDLGSMTVVPTIVRNAPHATTPEAVITNAGAWVEGPNTYRIMDKDGDYTDYTVTITRAALSDDATLSSLTVNGQAVALADGVFDYSFELPYGTSSAPAVVATPHHVAAVATVDPCTLSGATITVVPESGVGDQKVYTLTFTISPWKEVVIWDGSYMTDVETSPDATGLAWTVNGFGGISNYNATCGTKAYTKCLKSGGAASASRNVELVVPTGYIAKFYIVVGTHEDGTERGMFIGTAATKTLDASSILEINNSVRTEPSAGTSEIAGAGTWYINPEASVDFYEIRAYLRPGYARTAMLGNGVLGTICVPNNVAVEDIQGATFYELAGKNAEGKIAFDQITTELEAGVPYVFQANGDKLVLYYGNEHEDNPVDLHNGMYGTFTDLVLTELDDVYYFAQKALWSCTDLTSLSIPANRAYVKLSEIPAASASPAPGRIRMTLNVNGAPQVTTGMEEITNDQSQMANKVIIDGRLFILRGEKLYDATGRLVK